MFEYQSYFRNRAERDESAAAMEIYDDNRQDGLGDAGQDTSLGEQRLAAEVHRMWLIAATARICHEEGPGGVRLPYVARRAGVTPATAERLLGTGEACLIAAFRKAAALAAEITVPPFALETEPVERLRVGATQLLGFGETEPQLTAVLLCRSDPTQAQEQAMALALSRLVADDFDGPRPGRASLPDTRIAVDEAFGLIRARLGSSRPELLELLPTIVESLLTPQLGETAARIQAERPAPIFARPSLPGGDSPAPSLEIRLTASLLSEPRQYPLGAPPPA
jgi:AcrR family transcriptional regulator